MLKNGSIVIKNISIQIHDFNTSSGFVSFSKDNKKVFELNDRLFCDRQTGINTLYQLGKALELKTITFKEKPCFILPMQENFCFLIGSDFLAFINSNPNNDTNLYEQSLFWKIDLLVTDFICIFNFIFNVLFRHSLIYDQNNVNIIKKDNDKISNFKHFDTVIITERDIETHQEIKKIGIYITSEVMSGYPMCCVIPVDDDFYKTLNGKNLNDYILDRFKSLNKFFENKQYNYSPFKIIPYYPNQLELADISIFNQDSSLYYFQEVESEVKPFSEKYIVNIAFHTDDEPKLLEVHCNSKNDVNNTIEDLKKFEKLMSFKQVCKFNKSDFFNPEFYRSLIDFSLQQDPIKTFLFNGFKEKKNSFIDSLFVVYSNSLKEEKTYKIRCF